MKYLEQNGSWGLTETTKDHNGREITSSLDALLLYNYPTFAEMANQASNQARSLNRDSQHVLFPDVFKDDAKHFYVKSSTMNGLKELLEWKVSVIESDISDNQADYFCVPFERESNSSRINYSFADRVKVSSEDDMRQFVGHERMKFDLNVLDTSKESYKDFMHKKMILTELGFYDSVSSNKRIDFKSAHKFLQNLDHERSEGIIPHSEKILSYDNGVQDEFAKLRENLGMSPYQK